MKRLLLLLLVAGCEGPVTIEDTDPADKLAAERVNAVRDKRLSNETVRYMHANDAWGADAVEQHLRRTKDRRAAFVLAELSYFLGETEPAYYVAAAFYARCFVVDPELGPPPSRFDPLFRWAVDIYNLSLARFGPEMIESKKRRVDVLGRAFELNPPPNGARYRLATSFLAKNVRRSARVHGLGLPLIAEQTDERGYTMAYARTLLVTFEGSAASTKTIVCRGAIFDPSVQESVEIQGETIPLEADFTTPIAYACSRNPEVSGVAGLLNPQQFFDRGGLYMLAPYDKSKIPVVFVHGLAATPRTWIRMVNDLAADPVLRQRYQAWFYAWPTGVPMLWAAMRLRESLQAARKQHGFDELVLIGHSMGGLVSKLVVLDSGDRLPRLLSTTPFDRWDLPAETRDLLARAVLFEPLPFVRRVVFLATPHRGSPTVNKGVVRFGQQALMTTPPEMLQTKDALMAALRKDPGWNGRELDVQLMSSVGNLRPEHPVLREILTWRFPETLPVHSVIGREKEGADTDGVVTIASAHLDGVTSEKIVLSDHSVQESSGGVAEVRRILHLHLQEAYR